MGVRTKSKSVKAGTSTLNPGSIAALRRAIPSDELSFDLEIRKSHAGDKWFASHTPEAVVLARSTDTVVHLMKWATRYRVPVTARGAGHGYVGGCVPSSGGVVVSLARMNRIKEVHARDFVAVIEPGVLTKQLQDAVVEQGLFYPPDPASRADCTLGGNIATNAGGPSCLKYGVTRDYVLGLEVVLADGSVAQLGARTHKNKTGFDLTRLMVGSEGLLGIVTEATLKLLPRPPFRACLSAGFKDPSVAAQGIDAIFGAGFLPCALEVADSLTLSAARKRTGSRLLDGCEAHLLVELDGQEASVREEIVAVAGLIRRLGPVFSKRAMGAEQCEKLWRLRREFSYALRDTGLTKLNEDIVVPRGRLVELFQFANQLQARHGFPVACFGHAGDGNIHVNVMVDMTQPNARERSEEALDDLFRQVLDWGGAITGEHGVGLAKKRWWPQAASPAVRAAHDAVKAALDPLGILNPGKFTR